MLPYSVANAMASSLVSNDRVMFDSGSALQIIKVKLTSCNNFSYVEAQPISGFSHLSSFSNSIFH